MQYRNFTKDNIKVSCLGFGCMRFPILDNDSGKIDERKAIKMIRYAIDNGVNYIDTAYPYHMENSEILVGKALEDGYREKIHLATKNPVWLAKSYEDFEKYLDEQLQKLNTSYVDFYLLHALSKKRWDNIKELDVLKFLDDAKKSGKIKYAGFSFHDELDVFKEIVDSYDWDFCQIQLNYMDYDYQAGEEGLRYAKSKGLSVVIMEPIKGGKLAKTPSKEIQEVWDKAKIKRTPAEWALNWVLNHEEVSVVLSGMSTLEQVKENIKTASHAKPNFLNNDEIKLIEEVRNIYKDKIKVGCTGCEYCMPCPNDVHIPDIFEIYNNLYVYGTEKESINYYKKIKESKNDATKCVECGKCEEQCPQNLPIRKYLKEAEKVLNK
jgi:predicted aldo/keto reductase-like oxidoreductase